MPEPLSRADLEAIRTYSPLMGPAQELVDLLLRHADALQQRVDELEEKAMNTAWAAALAITAAGGEIYVSERLARQVSAWAEIETAPAEGGFLWRVKPGPRPTRAGR